jgi:hypothetical protein
MAMVMGPVALDVAMGAGAVSSLGVIAMNCTARGRGGDLRKSGTEFELGFLDTTDDRL